MPKKNTEIAVADSLELQVADEQKKRAILANYVQKNMVSGTDFYTLRIGGRETKPSLSKPGSEKVLSLFHWRAEFSKDDETWEMMGRPAGVLCYVCKLYTIKDGKLVGEGRGARDSKKDRDINMAIKMAEKSAQIDAVLRTGGLSDLFTQDVEDMQDSKPTEGVVIRMDEPFTAPAPKPKTTVIVEHLRDLGFDVRNMGRDEIDEKVRELTKLEMIPANYDEIAGRLHVLVNEKP